MYIERASYHARPGQRDAVLCTRREASDLRRTLGLRAGTMHVKPEPAAEGPDVQWECAFATAEDHSRRRPLVCQWPRRRRCTDSGERRHTMGGSEAPAAPTRDSPWRLPGAFAARPAHSAKRRCTTSTNLTLRADVIHTRTFTSRVSTPPSESRRDAASTHTA